MVVDNLGLVGATLSRSYRWLPRDLWDDAFQAGTLGLIAAVRVWTPESRYAFSTYATYRIREALTRWRTPENRFAEHESVTLDAPMYDDNDVSLADTLIAAAPPAVEIIALGNVIDTTGLHELDLVILTEQAYGWTLEVEKRLRAQTGLSIERIRARRKRLIAHLQREQPPP